MKTTMSLFLPIRSIALIALGLALVTRLSGPGWDIASVLAGVFLAVMAPLVLSTALGVRMFVSRRLTRPMITCPLLNVSVFGWPALFVSVFLREPQRFQLLVSCLTLGSVVGLIHGTIFMLAIKQAKATPQSCPDSNEARRIFCLLASAAAVLTAWQTVSWLYWDVGRSVGINVAYDGPGGTEIDFYGSAVDAKTVRIALGKPLAPGTIERIDLFGVQMARGFLPYENASEPSYRVVRRMAFYRTRVGDSILPLLTRFPTLTALDLRGTRITAAGARTLRSTLPRCKIIR